MENQPSVPRDVRRSSIKMYEGLGESYINAFLWLTALAFATSAIVAAIVRAMTRAHLLWCLMGAIVFGVLLAFGANSLFHRDLFVHRHQSRNRLVPDTGCLRYEPSFWHLLASYSMSREDFQLWVLHHPWSLQAFDSPHIIDYDAQRLNFTAPELAYATEMAANGGQLRVYYKDGVMYLSYSVM